MISGSNGGVRRWRPSNRNADETEFVLAAANELSPIDVWSEAFRRHPCVMDLTGLLTNTSPKQADISEFHAAGFLLGLLLQPVDGKKYQLPLTDDGLGRKVVRNAPKLDLSAKALKKISGAFRRPLGARVYHVYLNVPELQSIYPLALMPLGQAHFIVWLATHGREDFQLTAEEILWFFFQSASEWQRGVVLTYLTRPKWQEQFPLALTRRGWRPFRRALRKAYGKYLPLREIRKPPPMLKAEDEKFLQLRHRDCRPPDSPPLEGVNVISHFCNPSGIQQAAIWVKAALERVDLRTSCRDVPVSRRVIPSDREQWLGLEIFPVTILTQAGTPYFESGYDRAGLAPGKDVYRIAYWNWELETVPDEWVEVAHLVDEIWSPTEFVAKAMRARMPRPVYHILPGVEVGPVEPVQRSKFGIPEDHVVFLFMFDLHSQLHRKNPMAVFHAFREAFRGQDKASLIIKSSGGDIHATDLAFLQEAIGGANVRFVDEMMSRPQAYGLIAMADCFVSLHRSEGFGLGLAEAMLLGKPVIATGYSGNLDFMNRDNSLLVDFDMTEIKENRQIYTRGNSWAEPSVAHAAVLMRHVYESVEEAHARARRAQPKIRELLSLEAAGHRMRARLERIIGGNSLPR